MSATLATVAGSKRPLSDSSATTTDNGDHRKRRRNRTTQSCMNCHTSKRMCDRKRPCGRCTQLGLTALCVYQVAEANPKTGNETSRLQNRVTELETIIKELKNQPPQQMWTLNEHQTVPLNTSDTSPHPSPMKDLSPPTPCSTSMPSPRPSSSSSSDAYIDIPSQVHHGHTEHDLSALFNPSLQQELPKPDVLTQLIDRLASDKGPGEFDWTSPDRAGGHCGCANETNSYIVLLELSLRLRKASEVVGHHFKHFSGSTCDLNKRIAELDKFISHVLAACNSPPGFYPSPISPQHHHALPHASHSRSASHSVVHSPVSGTPMPMTPTGHNYSQLPMRPTLTSMGSFAMQSQMPTGPGMTYPSPQSDESMSQLERQLHAEWHNPVKGQAHSLAVS